jgi:hypothetical protein
MMAIWYVTFEVRRHGVRPKPRSPHETRTFATEADAKTFARAKLEDGVVLLAGTLNPYSPKQLIPASCIQSWLADDQEGDPAKAACADQTRKRRAQSFHGKSH